MLENLHLTAFFLIMRPHGLIESLPVTRTKTLNLGAAPLIKEIYLS